MTHFASTQGPLGDAAHSTSRAVTAETGALQVWCRDLVDREALLVLMRRRDDRRVRCAATGAPLALLVGEGSPLRYRFVCVACGEGSGWFAFRAGQVTGLTAPPDPPPRPAAKAR